MKFDVFFSICQTEVDGYMPSERVMFENFFDQVKLADRLGYGCAWLAETHLSCEIQKHGAQAVIPHFKGEIGLNTDILQLAHVIFSQTKNIEVGSAIRNILCNGGPIAHAEAVRTFLTLRSLSGDPRRLNLGFAAGRFEFSNRPYGIVPRNEIEKANWPEVKGKIMLEATEIFLRLLKGEKISSDDIPAQKLSNGQALEKRWVFENLGVIPFDAPLDLLKLTIGTHDPASQTLANQILPTGVFNLSITPPEVIEQTHQRMTKDYQGQWTRDLMPRTAMIFLDRTTEKAKKAAEKAWVTYWQAMEGTIDQRKVDQAVSNTLAGDAKDLAAQIKAKYHPDDRLMLWFDFNNHDNEDVKRMMTEFKEKVVPQLWNA